LFTRQAFDAVSTGSSAAIVVRIYGSDLAMLREKAHEMENAIAVWTASCTRTRYCRRACRTSWYCLTWWPRGKSV
jgi:hypothetical protein